MSDLISRQAAIDALKEHEDDKGYLRGDFEEILEALPSAEPVRCRGGRGRMTINKKLMRLHEQIEELKSRFCWNCQEWDCDGCSASDDDMRGEEDEA